jgi:hypothetical protein
MPPLFDVGTICFSRRALGVLGGTGIHPLELIKRHESGDWGAVTPEEWVENDRAVRDGHHGIASFYRFARALDLWVVTDTGRSRTRILLGDEW